MVLSGWMNSLYDRVIVFYVIILGDFFLGVGGGGVVWELYLLKSIFVVVDLEIRLMGFIVFMNFFELFVN